MARSSQAHPDLIGSSRSRLTVSAATLFVCVAAGLAALSVPSEAQAQNYPTPVSELLNGDQARRAQFIANYLRPGMPSGTYNVIAGSSVNVRKNVAKRMFSTLRSGKIFPRLLTGLNLLGLGVTAYWLVTEGLDNDPFSGQVVVPRAGEPPVVGGGLSQIALSFDQAQWASTIGGACALIGESQCYVMHLHATGTDGVGGLTLHFPPDNMASWQFADTDWCLTGQNYYNFCQPIAGPGGTNFQASGWNFAYAQSFWAYFQSVTTALGVTPSIVPQQSRSAPLTNINTYAAILSVDDYADAIQRSAVPGDTPTDCGTNGVQCDEYDSTGHPTESEVNTAIATATEDDCAVAITAWRMDEANYGFETVEEACEAAGGGGPGGGGGATLTIMATDENETYSQYVARLRAAGWVGTAHALDYDEGSEYFDGAYGNSGWLAAVATQNPTVAPFTGGYIYWDVDGDPGATYLDEQHGYNPVTQAFGPATEVANRPEIAEDDDLWFVRNPGATDPDPNPEPWPGPGPGTTPGQGCEPYVTSSLDMSPLTTLSLGTVFPFGVLAWAGDIFDDFTATPEAPSWTFNFSFAGFDFPPFTIDLSMGDEIMAQAREIIAWLLWVGAIWYFGAGLLGFRGGNPSEAIDDAGIGRLP